jgi:DtxR family Mn-dependent transcriptional regulator
MTSEASQADSHSRAVEDYVKSIYTLTQQGDKATTKALAERMGLGRGTVSGMVKQLAERGLVDHTPYYGARLTQTGRELAMRVLRRHRLIELFLIKTLDLGWDEVDDHAEQLEHAVSDRLIERIDAKLGHPSIDPHGSPIPNASGEIESQNFHPLSELPVGETAVVRRVSDADASFLQFLHEHGIKLGGKLKLVGHGPFGSVVVQVGKRELNLPREAAESIDLEA